MFSIEAIKRKAFDSAVSSAESALKAGGYAARRVMHGIPEIHAVDPAVARDLVIRAAEALAPYSDAKALNEAWGYLEECHPGALPDLFLRGDYWEKLASANRSVALLKLADSRPIARVLAGDLAMRELTDGDSDNPTPPLVLLRVGRGDSIVRGRTARERVELMQSNAPLMYSKAFLSADLATDDVRRGNAASAERRVKKIISAASDIAKPLHERVIYAAALESSPATIESRREVLSGIVSYGLYKQTATPQLFSEFKNTDSLALRDAMRRLVKAGGATEVMRGCMAIACNEGIPGDVQNAWAVEAARMCAGDEEAGKIFSEAVHYFYGRSVKPVTRPSVELLNAARLFDGERDRAVGALREIAADPVGHPYVRLLAAECSVGSISMLGLRYDEHETPSPMPTEPSWARRERLVARASEFIPMAEAVVADVLAGRYVEPGAVGDYAKNENSFTVASHGARLIGESGGHARAAELVGDLLSSAWGKGVRDGITRIADDAAVIARDSGGAEITRKISKEISGALETLRKGGDSLCSWRGTRLSQLVEEFKPKAKVRI